MEAGLPDVDTEYNVEGRAAHKLAADVLAEAYTAKSLNRVSSRVLLNTTIEIPVHLKAGGMVNVPVTPEMRNAVYEYVALVMETYSAIPGPKKLYIEHRVSLANLNPPEEMFGTADAIIVSGRIPGTIPPVPQQLVVIDLKYGTGVVVEVRDNPQLMEYALASMLSLPHEGDGMWADARFRTIIFQPRAPHPDGPVREWEYNYDEIREFGHKLLTGAHAAHAPDAPLTPGPWCRWCKAAAFCPALLKETQDVAQREFGTPMALINSAQFPGTTIAGTPGSNRALETVDAKYDILPPDPDRIPMDQALAVLDKAEMVEGFLAAIRERIRGAIKDGLEVPGWKLVAGRPVREWVSEGQLEQWALRPDSGLDVGELYEKVLRSPAQVEKIVGKKNLPADLYRKVSKSEKLVRVEDPRPALPSSAQKEFAALPPAASPNPIVGGGTGDVD